MIGIIIRILLLGAFVVLLVCAIGLFIMSGVAQSHDVVSIPVPQGTFIAGTIPNSDYSDAYVGPMEYAGFASIERVEQQAFHRGIKEVYRDEREVAFQGEALGYTYHVSYILFKDPRPSTLVVATTVKYGPDKKRRYLWKVAKQVHCRLMPYLLDRMIIMAPD